MTDEGCALGRGSPGAPIPAGDDAVARRAVDPAGGVVGPNPAPTGVPEPNQTPVKPAPDEVDAAENDAAENDAAENDDRVGGRDGGVTTRLARRCLTAAAILIGVAALCLLTVALRRWDVPSALLALLALPAMGGGVLMSRRRVLWTSVARAVLPAGVGTPATSGDPRPLSPSRSGSLLKRRLVAVVLPLRADYGRTPGDGAVIVHARADGAAPAAGDRLRVVPIARKGDPIAPATDPRDAVRVLLVRESDGTVFVATTRVTDTW